MLRLSLPALHPWFDQRGRTLLRSRPSVREGAAWVAALCGVAALLSLTGTASALLRVAAALPGPSAVLIALIVGTLASRRLLLLAAELRTGWFAALPISTTRARGTLFVVALGHLLAGIAVWCAIVAFAWFDSRAFVSGSFVPCATGVGAGMALALWRALRPARALPEQRAGRREPAFTLNTSAPLSAVLQWQRRAVVLQWRLGQGGHFWLVGAMLVLLPDRMGLMLAAGVLLMVVPWLWASLALRVSLQAAVEALQLLRATPMDASAARKALLRYPLIALACATATAFVGNLLLGFSWIRLLAWAIALAVVCAPSAWRMSHALRNPHA
ncbi:hypothetical protein GCM10025759_02130 [Lysobacter panacisoli]|uniref:ABC transporter permease n=2 Tax=Lysobacter panacisoli TaxID=1255263 RepID=A0ABP9KX65_9GAMM